MNPEDIMKAMQQQMGGMGQRFQSTLSRQPTTEELDKFIDRCMKEKDLNPKMLFQQIVYQIQPPEGHTTMNSFVEEEVYPMVLNRIKARFEGK